MKSQKRQNDLVRFQGKPFNITVIQAYAPTSNAEEAEVERFYEDLQDLLELKPKKDVLFIIGDWNAKVAYNPKVNILFVISDNILKTNIHLYFFHTTNLGGIFYSK